MAQGGQTRRWLWLTGLVSSSLSARDTPVPLLPPMGPCRACSPPRAGVGADLLSWPRGHCVPEPISSHTLPGPVWHERM